MSDGPVLMMIRPVGRGSFEVELDEVLDEKRMSW